MSIVVCCCVWAWTGVLYQSNKEVYYTYTVYVVVSTCLLFCVVICRYSCALCVHSISLYMYVDAGRWIRFVPPGAALCQYVCVPVCRICENCNIVLHLPLRGLGVLSRKRFYV